VDQSPSDRRSRSAAIGVTLSFAICLLIVVVAAVFPEWVNP
jgi:hypothetical protein